MKKGILKAIILIGVLIFSITTVNAVEKNIGVTATVKPQPSDVEILITADKPEGTELSPDEIVTFTFKYQTNSYSEFPLTLIGSWEQGLIEGTASYVDVYDYVLGSGSNSDDGTIPVIDLLNNKITWNISGFARDGDNFHEVSFQLRVKPTFLTTSRIQVFSNINATYDTALTTEKEYMLYVDPALILTATPTPTLTISISPISTLTPTPNPSNPTPTPTVTKKLLYFDKVIIQDVSQDNFLIIAQTNIESQLTVLYWKCDKNEVNKAVFTEKFNKYHEIRLDKLEPSTLYCFQITAFDKDERDMISDIFSLNTASNLKSYTIQSASTFWQNIRLNSSTTSILGAPKNIPVVLTVDIDNAESIKKIEGEFVNRSVLGTNSQNKVNEQKIDLIEVGEGVFSAEILTPKILDDYYFVLKIRDKNGGFSKKILPYTFRIVQEIKIIDSAGKAVEQAHILIERFEESRGTFVRFNDAFPQANTRKGFFGPYYSDEEGMVNIGLPAGKYRVTISAIGYAQLFKPFSIDNDFTSFPVFELKTERSIRSLVKYFNFSFGIIFETFAIELKTYFSTELLRVLLMFLEVIMMGIFIIMLVEKFGLISRLHSKVGTIISDLTNNIFNTFLSLWTISNVFITLLIIIFQGLEKSYFFIIITILIGAIDILIFIRTESIKLKK